VGRSVVDLDTPIGASGLPRAAALRKVGGRLGIRTVRDLLFHLPRRYDDLRRIRTLVELLALPDGELVSARARVTELHVEQTWRRRVQRTTALLVDDTGQAEATWFGRRFIERRLRPGAAIIVSGRLKRRGFSPIIDNPDFSLDHPAAGEALHAGRIVPVYRLTAGITAQSLRLAIRAALDGPAGDYPEYLPIELLRTEHLVGIATALDHVHFPPDWDALAAGLRRLAFDELYAIQIGMVGRSRARTRETAPAIAVDDRSDGAIRSAIVEAVTARLGGPVELTPDQAAAMTSIRFDLGRDRPMVRLLQGDVGSGKTAVAAYAMAATARAGRQGVLLAPTDLLARQHADTLGSLLEPLGIGVTLLTASLAGNARARATEHVRSGQALAVVGTHALLSESVSFADLALAIVDEQHRFGVAQREALEAKAAGRTPHVLLMTATPIPRTVGQVLYGDLDVSDLRSLPKGRQRIRTAIRRPSELDSLWRFVRQEAMSGHRTFVVVPLIGEASDGDDTLATVDQGAWAAAVEVEATRLRDLTGLRIGIVHGRMRAPDRDAEMARFRSGTADVLVGTTVVEVGVDVPEATVMVVEDADRFGLAQLHQLRGRVGRGPDASYCVLVSAVPEGTVGWARLSAVVSIVDGFELAERDLELRREGNVLGYVQSGLPPLRVASLQRAEHRDLAASARRWAERVVAPDGTLAGPAVLSAELAHGWLAGVAAAEPVAEA
jgi:ATP-dependent DNA helicase RecG